MKLRSYFRQPVNQAALLKLPDIADVPCEIINFSPAGLCLKLTGSDSLISEPDERTVAEVIFTPSGKVITFRIQGTLSHVSQRNVGFVFSHSPPFSVLLSLQEKALPNPLSESFAQDELLAIHKQCIRAFENAIGPILEKLSAQLMAELREASVGGASGATQPLEDESIDEMAHQGKTIVETFYVHALEQVKSFVVPDLSLQPEAGAIYTDSISKRLVFEDWMNLIDKVIRLETKNEDILEILASRFSVLVHREIANHDNPFGPSVLFHAFHYSLDGSLWNNSKRNIVYEVFTRFMDECLTSLYDDLQNLTKPLETWLKANSKPETSTQSMLAPSGETLQLEALPLSEDEREANMPFPFHEPEAKIEHSPKKQVELSPPTAKNTAKSISVLEFDRLDTNQIPSPVQNEIEPLPERISKTANAPRQQPDAFAAFVLLSRYAESQEYRGPSESSSDFDSAPLIAALQKLQSEGLYQQQAYFTAPRLQAGLAEILTETGQEKLLISMEVRETLQILGLLLDAILADTAIPCGITAYFKRLQIPLLIAAFADPSLLHGKSHPARDVLNQIDYLALATNAQGEIDNDKLLQSLNNIVDRLCAGKAGDPSVFKETLESLRKLTAPLIKANATRLERVVESCEGGHRLEQARRLVDREIDARMGGKTVHAIVPALVDAGWRQLLVLTSLRLGTENDEWRRQLSIIDLLLNRLSKNAPSNLPSQFNVQALKDFILEQLSSIGSESAATNRIVDEIAELMANGVSEVSTLAYVDVPSADTEREEKEITLQTRLQGFRVGDWLKFAVARNTWTPLRLAWVGENPPRYVFVNRKGVKTLDLDAVRFIQLLDEKRAGRIESLEEFPLVERTSKALLHTLRERLR